MPQIVLANNIGQPTTEVQAQTQKVRFTPVTVSSEGSVTPAKEIPSQQATQPAPVQHTEVQAAAKAPEPKVPQKSEKDLQDSERFNAIIRREKAMRAKAREYETELNKYRAQVAELDQIKSLETQRQERLKADPVGFLTEQGYTTDQITQALLNQPGPESMLLKQLSDKISRMEKEQRDALERQKQESDANYQNALKTIQRNVDKLVTNNPEFEAISASEAQASVTSYIEKVWKAEGIVLDVEDAAKEIEDYLTEQALGLAKMKKVQSRLRPPAPSKQATPTTAPAKPVTLTNQVKQNTRPLTPRERAIMAFKRELK